MSSSKNVYEVMLMVVENRETGEFSAFFATNPMVIGRGKGPNEAIEDLVATNIPPIASSREKKVRHDKSISKKCSQNPPSSRGTTGRQEDEPGGKQVA